MDTSLVACLFLRTLLLKYGKFFIPVNPWSQTRVKTPRTSCSRRLHQHENSYDVRDGWQSWIGIGTDRLGYIAISQSQCYYSHHVGRYCKQPPHIAPSRECFIVQTTTDLRICYPVTVQMSIAATGLRGSSWPNSTMPTSPWRPRQTRDVLCPGKFRGSRRNGIWALPVSARLWIHQGGPREWSERFSSFDCLDSAVWWCLEWGPVCKNTIATVIGIGL